MWTARPEFGGLAVPIWRTPSSFEAAEGGLHEPRSGCVSRAIPEAAMPARLIFTDAYTKGFAPSAAPFMTGEILFAPTADGRTHYVAMAHHWRAEDMQAHRDMGFEAGWNAAADQLEALAKGL